MNLGQIGLVKGDSSAIMHVRPDSKDFPPNLKWRGIALSEFDGKRWFNPPGARPDSAVEREWIFLVGNGQRLRRDGRHISYRVDLNAVDSDALFIAGWPEAIYIGGRRLMRAPNESFRLDMIPFETFRYSVSAFVEGPLEPEALELPSALSEPYVRLPRVDPRIPDLARQVTATLPSGYDRAHALEQYLRTQYGYTLDLPASEAADPAGEFPVRAQERPLRIFRLRPGRDAAHARHSRPHGQRISKRHAESGVGSLRDPRLGRA